MDLMWSDVISFIKEAATIFTVALITLGTLANIPLLSKLCDETAGSEDIIKGLAFLGMVIYSIAMPIAGIILLMDVVWYYSGMPFIQADAITKIMLLYAIPGLFPGAPLWYITIKRLQEGE